MSEERVIRLLVESDGQRLDRYLARRLPDHSRTAVQRLIAEGRVLVNGLPTKAAYRPQVGDIVEIALPTVVEGGPRPEAIPLDIIYEDADLAVVNKPAGMVVHPAPGHPGGTLMNALMARYPELAAEGGERPGIVHRLDRDTSGLILVALNRATQWRLQRLFARRAVPKRYLALVEGTLQPLRGLIEAPVGRDPRCRQKMAVVQRGGRPARTAYRVREYLPGYTLVLVRPQTGRTHQIRVHFAAIGHPVAGDLIYGGRPVAGLQRQFLHAWRLTIPIPSTGEWRTFTAPLPADLEEVLRELRASRRA